MTPAELDQILDEATRPAWMKRLRFVLAFAFGMLAGPSGARLGWLIGSALNRTHKDTP